MLKELTVLNDNKKSKKKTKKIAFHPEEVELIEEVDDELCDMFLLLPEGTMYYQVPMSFEKIFKFVHTPAPLVFMNN